MGLRLVTLGKDLVDSIKAYDNNFKGYLPSIGELETLKQQEFFQNAPLRFFKFLKKVPLFSGELYIPLRENEVDLVQWADIDKMISRSIFLEEEENSKWYVFIAESISSSNRCFYLNFTGEEINIFISDDELINQKTKFKYLCKFYKFLSRTLKQARDINRVFNKSDNPLLVNEFLHLKLIELLDAYHKHAQGIKKIKNISIEVSKLIEPKEFEFITSSLIDRGLYNKLEDLHSELNEHHSEVKGLKDIIENLIEESRSSMLTFDEDVLDY